MDHGTSAETTLQILDGYAQNYKNRKENAVAENAEANIRAWETDLEEAQEEISAVTNVDQKAALQARLDQYQTLFESEVRGYLVQSSTRN